MKSEKNHIVLNYAKVCVTSLSVVARNNDGLILEKPKYIIKKKLVSTAGDDKICSCKPSVIK